VQFDRARCKLSDHIQPEPSMSPHPATETEAPKARILIVEDEVMIVFGLEHTLLAAGFEIAGVAGQLDTALEMIGTLMFDAAILDTRLAGISAGPAAAALRESGRPFIVSSGYAASQQEDAFKGAPCIQKPYRPQRLIELVREVLPQFPKPAQGSV
jgi:DNA-binding response OmpR family regulator